MTDDKDSLSETNIESLSQSIDRLEKSLDSISHSQRTSRTAVLAGSLLLFLMFCIVGFNLFKTLKTQLNEETIQAALQMKAEELLPSLQEKFAKAAMKAVPTYRKLTLERLKTLRPKLQSMITKEQSLWLTVCLPCCKKKQTKASRGLRTKWQLMSKVKSLL